MQESFVIRGNSETKVFRKSAINFSVLRG